MIADGSEFEKIDREGIIPLAISYEINPSVNIIAPAIRPAVKVTG